MSEYIVTTEQLNWFLERMDETVAIPAAIAHLKPIIRCRDCKFYRFVDRSDIFQDEHHNDSFCLRFVDGKRMEVESDGFCAWGERRDA